MTKPTNDELFNSIISNSDMYYISLIMLSAFNKKSYKNIPELALVLDEDNLLRFLDVYGGETIQIPTKEEFLRYVKSIMVYYYNQVKGMGIHASMSKANATGDGSIQYMVGKMKKYINDLKLPIKDD